MIFANPKFNSRCRSLLSSFFLIVFFSPTFAQTPAPSPTPNAAIEDFAAALFAAPTDEARDALISAQPNLATAELVQTLVRIGNKSLDKSEFASGERAFALALRISEKIGDKAVAALALRSLGSVSGMKGNFSAALDYFTRALARYEEIADESGVARAASGIGTAQASLGNYDAAVAAFRRSLEINERLKNKSGMANAYSSLNVTYQYLGDFERALENGRRALQIARETGDKAYIGMANSNLGSLYKSRGDFRSSLEAQEEALILFEEAGNKGRVALTLNNIGGVLLAQNDFGAAEDYFQRSLVIREQIGDKDGIARAALRLGEVKFRENDYPAALTFLNRSVALRDESADPSALAEALNFVGKVYFKQGDAVKAAENLTRALQIAERINERETTANVSVSLARFHLAQRQLDAAKTEAERAVALSAQLGLREVLWEAATVAGEIYLAMNDANRARASFADAVKTIEESRLLVAGGERDREQFFESKIAPYQYLTEIAVRENKYADALAFAERAKARVLLDVLESGNARFNKTLTSDEKERETKLRGSIFTLNANFQKEAERAKPDAARLDQLRGQLTKARFEYNVFTELLYDAHPELKLQRGETRIASPADLNALLPDNDSALAEYVVTENQTFLFVATRGKTNAPDLKVYPLNLSRQELSSAVADFRNVLARRDILFGKSAKKLYAKLIAPADAQLNKKTRLIIVPDASLWELPFQALLSPAGRYVVEEHAVSYAPSLSVLAALERSKRETKTAVGGDLLAFGNPSLPTNKNANGKNDNPILMTGTNFIALPEAEKQVKALSALYAAKRSRVFVGASAAEDEFKREAANFRIIHLATHGVLDDASPLYSYVLLSKSEGSKEDGRLQAWEIMQMNLNADLVVLSACESGRGGIRSGEGIIGLSWALFVAGSPTTVASQWKVESASTTELMLGFYRNLQANSAAKKSTKAEALRRASLALLKSDRYAHPFYWAGFVIVGAGD